ncbi:hypothetical protein S7335_1726 [Synechococcus sp. PCC 7335]|uniref:hypothetical protein n=1 Tax=Synechococcus sp. (strain ATCC 29403 / PCC 7335) TaxID=91464 RepID=UPI00017EE707|nr:hypothetical protein [Synechococcus sp. PCC 7335]EDX84029.1 hypothetical protein S7335_1726 [Synechococcus sp. PCC 7335]
MTTTQTDGQWSNEERRIAESALKKAYRKETEALIANIRENAANVTRLEDVWQLHDFLSAKRHDIDGKYDDREDFLMFTLSKLIKTGLLDKSDLQGLAADKRAKVTVLTRM